MNVAPAPASAPAPDAMRYQGEELELFAHAANWKRYLREQIAPLLRGRVLEVGAGLGGTTRVLCDRGITSWTALEPDRRLADQLRESVIDQPFPVPITVVQGTVDSLPADERFDAILYIDVLEHIEDDREEVGRAARRVTSDGALVALSPAHQWLFSPFDARIGHHRRYTRRSISALTPWGCTLERLVYLDAVGILASLANRVLLRQSAPTPAQVLFWDRRIVPVSRRIDRLFRYGLGKSVLAVWRRLQST